MKMTKETTKRLKKLPDMKVGDCFKMKWRNWDGVIHEAIVRIMNPKNDKGLIDMRVMYAEVGKHNIMKGISSTLSPKELLKDLNNEHRSEGNKYFRYISIERIGQDEANIYML